MFDVSPKDVCWILEFRLSAGLSPHSTRSTTNLTDVQSEFNNLLAEHGEVGSYRLLYSAWTGTELPDLSGTYSDQPPVVMINMNESPASFAQALARLRARVV